MVEVIVVLVVAFFALLTLAVPVLIIWSTVTTIRATRAITRNVERATRAASEDAL